MIKYSKSKKQHYAECPECLWTGSLTNELVAAENEETHSCAEEAKFLRKELQAARILHRQEQGDTCDRNRLLRDRIKELEGLRAAQ